MKLKFLDARNCHALLPRTRGLSMAQLLDKFLGQVNDQQGEQHGSIDTLIRHNERTINRARGSQRCCNSPYEIIQDYNAVSGEVDLKVFQKPWRGSALLQTNLVYKNGRIWRTFIPLQFLLKGWGDANRDYQCYAHTIALNVSQIQSYADLKARYEAGSDDYHYVGITSRNWLLRLTEHSAEMRRLARYKFHQAWRLSLGVPDVHFASALVDINQTYENAMNWEEYQVDQLGSNCLNMIPGGFKGLKVLHEHRIIERVDISLEEREKAIAEFVRRHPKKGIPHPSMADHWKKDEFYLKVNEARSDRLSKEQVRKIRELADMGWSVSEIKTEVDARNERQVKDVITGKYYGRIH